MRSDRRTLLGALVVGPAALTLPSSGLSATPSDAWSHAMREWSHAKMASDTVTAQYNALPKSEQDKIGTEMDAFADREGEAENRLMQMPAPDLTALLWKLEHAMVEDDEQLMAISLTYVRQTMCDMRRLLG